MKWWWILELWFLFFVLLFDSSIWRLSKLNYIGKKNQFLKVFFVWIFLEITKLFLWIPRSECLIKSRNMDCENFMLVHFMEKGQINYKKEYWLSTNNRSLRSLRNQALKITCLSIEESPKNLIITEKKNSHKMSKSYTKFTSIKFINDWHINLFIKQKKVSHS